ncbi:hypothetical protein Nepgr_024567 [Nepenthes gracilis]|uniref:C2 domain-containing protein n=1 Tax=Nepenthes gracilis TaxID=150966 RepID=A0AAD3Y056_NEPGR|nr:hypothetical protein Nepgr_024567 [Nepenthes gracilis]
MLGKSSQPLILEITIISAQGIKNTTRAKALFSRRLMPFITITTFSPPPRKSISCSNGCRVYRTEVAERGGADPTWGGGGALFQIPLHPTFFVERFSCIHLHLFTKRLILGPAPLGWCQIPAADIFDGSPAAAGVLHHLSYRLRDRDGTRGHGIVNIAVKLTGIPPRTSCPQPPANADVKPLVGMTTAIGIPLSRKFVI